MLLTISLLVASILTVLTFLTIYFRCRKNRRGHENGTTTPPPIESIWNYMQLKYLVQTEKISLPAMFVDMDIFDQNARRVIGIVKQSGKTLRMATKSIRCPKLIRRITELGEGVIQGYMCYSVQEADFLSRYGLDDFYIPYPTFQSHDVTTALAMTQKGKKISLTVDSISHVKKLDELCCYYSKIQTRSRGRKGGERLSVVIDLDMSYKLFKGKIRLGAHRSNVDSVAMFSDIVHAIKYSDSLKLVGIMGYEAHVAGLPDKNPNESIPSVIICYMKRLFYNRAQDIRRTISNYCKAEGIAVEFFNGGGSGNIRDACADPATTEVTAGSAFIQSQLFDYFVNNECQPAACFALQATRINDKWIVCQSGGFVASGSCSNDKFPLPFSNPLKLQCYPDEGFGEVQTPLRIKGPNSDVTGDIQLGDPVFFRPAKSGEISEHFQEYHLIRNYKVEEIVKTYRGLGKVFY